MNHNHFPPLEPESSLPEVLPEIPKQMELLEDRPVIKELSFQQEAPAQENQIITEEEPTSEFPSEETVAEEIPFVEELFPEEETVTETETAVSDEVPVSQEPLPEEAVIVPAITPEDLPEELTDVISNEDFQDFESLEPEYDHTPLPVSEDIPPAAPAEEVTDQGYHDNLQDSEAMMNAEEPKPESSQPMILHNNYKGRPKRKKGEGLLGIPSILVTFVWLALILIIGVTAGRMLWICAADVLAFGREDKVVTVTIYESDSMETIIDKLHEGDLIRYKSLFRLYAGISDAEEDIQPGIYDLNTRYDYHALVSFMSPRSSREVIKLTIPEGYTCRQIFALLEENRICTALDAASYAAKGELSEYWFLDGLERGSENCLEGYLFPDTYEFYKNSTPREAIERMLDNFDYRFNEEMFAQLETLNKNVTDGNYGIREIVIIASLIEKESAAPGESPMVSGVIYNRLFKWGNNPPYLNIDASIVYAQDGNNDRIDTSLDHPYNTYLYEGLTPGPIANPGLASLKAALNPESHNYYYYVLNPETGMHQFSTTYQEHQGYVRQFNAAPEVEIE